MPIMSSSAPSPPAHAPVPLEVYRLIRDPRSGLAPTDRSYLFRKYQQASGGARTWTVAGPATMGVLFSLPRAFYFNVAILAPSSMRCDVLARVSLCSCECSYACAFACAPELAHVAREYVCVRALVRAHLFLSILCLPACVGCVHLLRIPRVRA